MAQNNRRAKKHASPRHPERRIPGWLWLLTGIVIGGFAMFLIHLTELKRSGVSTTSAPTPKQDQVETSSSAKPLEAPKKELIFEFYDRLKNEQVTIPDYEKPEDKAARATHHYFLQVASFRRQADADKTRAQLLLLNMDASVETSTLQSGATAFRVIVGPFQSRSKLAKARETLVSNGFEFLTLKRKI